MGNCNNQKYPEFYNSRGPLRLLYWVWVGIGARCRPGHAAGRRYYDRGIRMCDEWKDLWPTFCDWALQHGYDPKLQIDRINNDGNYEPSNCRFVTASENNLNKDKLNARLNGVAGRMRTKGMPFVCRETNEVFLTMRSAARRMRLERSAIAMVLKGIYKQAKGFTFEYIMIPLSMYDELIEREMQEIKRELLPTENLI